MPGAVAPDATVPIGGHFALVPPPPGLSDQTPSRIWMPGPVGEVAAGSRTPWGSSSLTPAHLLYRTHGCCPGQEWQANVYRNDWGDLGHGCYPPICEADGWIPSGVRFAPGVAATCIPRPAGWDPRWGCHGLGSGVSGAAPAQPPGWQPQPMPPAGPPGLPSQPRPIPVPGFDGTALAIPDDAPPDPGPPPDFGKSKYPLSPPPNSTWPGAPDYLYISIGNRLPLQSTAPEIIPEAPVGYTLVKMLSFGKYPQWDTRYETQPTGPIESFVFQYIDSRLFQQAPVQGQQAPQPAGGQPGDGAPSGQSGETSVAPTRVPCNELHAVDRFIAVLRVVARPPRHADVPRDQTYWPTVDPGPQNMVDAGRINVNDPVLHGWSRRARLRQTLGTRLGTNGLASTSDHFSEIWQFDWLITDELLPSGSQEVRCPRELRIHVYVFHFPNVDPDARADSPDDRRPNSLGEVIYSSPQLVSARIANTERRDEDDARRSRMRYVKRAQSERSIVALGHHEPVKRLNWAEIDGAVPGWRLFALACNIGADPDDEEQIRIARVAWHSDEIVPITGEGASWVFQWLALSANTGIKNWPVGRRVSTGSHGTSQFALIGRLLPPSAKADPLAAR